MWQCSSMILNNAVTFFNYSADFVRWQVSMKSTRNQLAVFPLVFLNKFVRLWEKPKTLNHLLRYHNLCWFQLGKKTMVVTWQECSTHTLACLFNTHIQTATCWSREKPITDTHFYWFVFPIWPIFAMRLGYC